MIDSSLFWPLVAALLWGLTNPFLKKFASGFAERPEGGGVLGEVKFLLQRPKYLMTQGLNLCGSAVFFWGLREGDVSTASIMANSLSFAITLLTSSLVLKEEPMPPRAWLGALLILGGVSVCMYAKSQMTQVTP
jgi:drug/metabolite transporter (DMT)-like permease